MKFSGKIEDGTSNKPLNFGSDPCPWWRFALSECTLQAVCAVRVLLVNLFFFYLSFAEKFTTILCINIHVLKFTLILQKCMELY